jgi:hypothetical protein
MDDIAVALKTGKDVLLARVPIQLVTFLKVNSMVVIGDDDGTIGQYEMINVCPKLQKQKRSTEKLHENITSIGWIQYDRLNSDACKNIPGYVYLYNQYPNKKWYVMVDDDTFIFWNNLLDFVQDYDYLKPWYFGLSTNFVGCDGIYKYGQGPLFAHGGSGIVLSQKAVEMLVLKSNECITKYDTCWAGDVRLALCLRDIGIHVDGRGEFHKDPPNDEFEYQDPCIKPISFHHLLPHQIQTLYDIKGNATMASLAPHFLSKDVQMDTDRPGMDYKSYYEPSGSECYQQCVNDPQCASFSYHRSLCSLKYGIPKQKEVIGSISGLVLDHFKCKQ